MPDQTIVCIYASASGNVEIVAETVAKVLRAEGLTVDLHRAEQTDISLIANNQAFLFATSTWERGQINPYFKKLLRAMEGLDFTGKKAGFIGLGDIRYETVFFNRGIGFLHDLWQKNNGEILFRPLRLNGDPYQVLDTTVTNWARDIAPYFRGEKSGSAEAVGAENG